MSAILNHTLARFAPFLTRMATYDPMTVTFWISLGAVRSVVS